jgi:hypothetical protein
MLGLRRHRTATLRRPFALLTRPEACFRLGIAKLKEARCQSSMA